MNLQGKISFLTDGGQYWMVQENMQEIKVDRFAMSFPGDVSP